MVFDQKKELPDNKKDSFLNGLVEGMYFDFCQFNEQSFLVGTEKRKIHFNLKDILANKLKLMRNTFFEYMCS